MSQLTLFLFGSPRLERDGTPIEIDRRKAVALMAYLAVTSQEHSRDALATLLWPDYDQTRARGALRRTLSVLNKALGGTMLEATRETINLNRSDELWGDVAQFRQQVAAYQTHDHPPPELCPTCLSALAEAVSLYRDDFMAGFTLRDSPDFDEWQFFQAEDLRRDLAGALERLVHYHCAQMEYEPATTFARRWLELDTLHEPVHQLLMQLYAWTNQRAAALRQYQECVRILEEELGISPSEETATLYEQIRTGRLDGEMKSPPNKYGHEKEEDIFSPAPVPHRRPTPPAPPPFLSSPPPRPTSVAPFVAREDELTQINSYLQAALAGQGQVAFITGEAGSGKTALVHEFARRAQDKTTNLVVARGNCNAHLGSGDPYLPFREILALLTGDVESKWNQGMLTEENAGRLWNLVPTSVQTLIEFGPDLIDTFIPRATLVNRAMLPLSNGAESLAQRNNGGNGASGVAQSDLFEQYTKVLQALARQQPLLLMIDDAQWADVASINLLFHLGRHLTGNRILTLITYRPDDVALGRGGERHPLESVVNELKRIYGDVQIDLDQSAGHQFVEALLDSQANQLGSAFRTALYHHTQGHPLFTVELLWDMQQRGDLVKNRTGRWVTGSHLNWETLPARVEAIIKERLDRLDEKLRDILAVASVEGEHFTAQVVARVQGISERQLLRDLSQELEKRHRLVQSEGEVEVGNHFLSRYRFSHTLFQQYLYHSLSTGERRLLHGDIAAALEKFYAGQTNRITIPLARHYAEAGQADQAIDYLLQAGDRARNLYANQAAIDFYEQALVFLQQQRTYERAARTLMKLGLTHHLAFNFQEARRAYEQGFALWQRAGASQPTSFPPAPHALRMCASDPATLDPTLADDSSSAIIINNLFRGLVELSSDLEVMPDVARSWEVIDGCKYIFQLRDDVRWSDGTPVTAEDFEYAWKRVLNPNTNSRNAALLYDVKGARALHQGQASNSDQVGVRALDPVTLEVDLEGPTSYFPHLLTYGPTYALPRHILEKHGQTWTKIENIVTSGPFRLESWQPGQSMVLVRNPDYRGHVTGNLQRVELLLERKSPARLELYEANNVDVLYFWFHSGLEMDRIRRQYADDYLSLPSLGTHYIAFNVTRPPFDDPRVRRAFAMAIDKETLADVILGGYFFPATGGFVPPGMPGHSPGIGLPYDPDQARQLLAAAGYPDGRSFPAIEWLMGPDNAPLAEYLQSHWRENLNIHLTWDIINKEAQYYERVNKSRPHLASMGWSADYPDPDNFLRVSAVCRLSGWHNEAYEQLVEEARRVTDQAKRLALYQQADQILMREAPILPYIYIRTHLFVKPWVTRYPTSSIRSTFWKEVIIEPH